MATRARLVLKHCRLACNCRKTKRFAARAPSLGGGRGTHKGVGYVLDKVDGESQAVKSAARAAFARTKSDAPEHEIFRKFIERERNAILKLYDFNLHPSDEAEFVLVGKLPSSVR